MELHALAGMLQQGTNFSQVTPRGPRTRTAEQANSELRTRLAARPTQRSEHPDDTIVERQVKIMHMATHWTLPKKTRAAEHARFFGVVQRAWRTRHDKMYRVQPRVGHILDSGRERAGRPRRAAHWSSVEIDEERSE